jgi:lambda family phage portal protein
MIIQTLAKILIVRPFAAQIANIVTRAYDGATHSKNISWFASSSTANSETMLSLETLRARARDLSRNNAYATRTITSIASNTIGTGIMHQFKNFDQEVWKKWSESTECDAHGIHTFNGLQNLIMRETAEAGECLVQRIHAGYNGKNIPLKLRVIESEYLDMNRNGFFNGSNYISQGIEFSPLGQRVAYWIYPYHPENDLGWRHTSIRVPANEIIHIFKCDRAGQSRGITWLAPVMMEFRNIDNYQAAELKRREVSACYAAFIRYIDELPEAVKGTLKNGAEKIIDKIYPGMVAHLQPGQDVTFSNPQSDSNYDPFISSVLRKIAVGAGITYEILAGNLSKVNFSSGRMGFLEFQRNIDIWRWHMMIPMFNTKVSQWFLETAAIAGYNTKKAEVTYTAAHREMIDPPKEIAAMRDAIRSGLKSYPEALRELGYNPFEVINEIAEFNKIIDKLEITLDCDPRKVTQQGQFQQNKIEKTKSKKRTKSSVKTSDTLSAA